MTTSRAFIAGCAFLCCFTLVSAQGCDALAGGPVDRFCPDPVFSPDWLACCFAEACTCENQELNGSCQLFAQGHASCTECCAPTPTCDDGTFQSAPDCQPCLSSCETCNNDGACTRCKDGYFEEPSGFSSVEGGEGQCRRCPVGCDKCSDESSCTECRTGFSPTLTGGGPCGKCPAGCATCAGSASAPTCSKCNSGRYKTADGKCLYSCPAGEYEISSEDTSVGGDCGPCPNGCETCKEAANGVTENEGTVCFTCKDKLDTTPTFFQNGECLEQCQEDSATYEKSATSVCAPCPHACAKCTDLDDCSECEATFTLASDGKRCVLNCPTGEIKVNGRCVACEGNCKICSGTTTQCLSCTSESTTFYDSTTSKCVTATGCPPRTYPKIVGEVGEEIRTCAPCNPRCAECTGPERDCSATR